jgi:integrase
LPSVGLYTLRHTCAALLLLADQPAKVVSERLGHSSVTLTLDTYSHVLPT